MNALNLHLSPYYDLFIDLIHNDSENKQDRVMLELKSSQYVIVIRTPLIEQSLWVKTEINEANKKNIPVLYTDLIDDKNAKFNICEIVQKIKTSISVD